MIGTLWVTNESPILPSRLVSYITIHTSCIEQALQPFKQLVWFKSPAMHCCLYKAILKQSVIMMKILFSGVYVGIVFHSWMKQTDCAAKKLVKSGTELRLACRKLALNFPALQGTPVFSQCASTQMCWGWPTSPWGSMVKQETSTQKTSKYILPKRPPAEGV